MKIINRNELGKYIVETKRVPKEEVAIIYANDINDGPIEGVCSWKNKNYYFLWYGGMDEKKDEMIRKFLIIDLSEAQWSQENKAHDEFIRKSNSGQLNEFYTSEKEPEGVSIDKEQIIGWFE